MKRPFSWKIGGPAGLGIMSSGPMFARIVKRAGFHTIGYPEYPSVIKGGYNNFQVTFSDKEMLSPWKAIDVFVALDKVMFERETITEDHTVIVDLGSMKEPPTLAAKKVIDVPMSDIVKEVGGPDVMRNSVAVGASAAVLGLPFDLVERGLRELYCENEKVCDLNISVARKGFECCGSDRIDHGFIPTDVANQPMLSGNDAMGTGAIRAGMHVYAAYPMSPASSILHFLAEHEVECGYVTKHTEDEIAAVNLAVGASFAGARAMVGTSGGGFALMNEALGLAAITEAPLVMILAQRPGPATGLPTWTEQSDLLYAIHASQDEFVRAVYSPGDVSEAYTAVTDAFNAADTFQVPALVLSDKFLSESTFMTGVLEKKPVTVESGFVFKGDEAKAGEFFPRYREKKNGVAERAIPGTVGGIHIAPGNEHDEYGFVTDNGENRIKMQSRRMSKEPHLARTMPHPNLYGNPDAPLTFVCFGSTKAVMMECLKDGRADFNVVHFPAVHPLEWDRVEKMLDGKNLVLAETNATGQLGKLIRMHTGIRIDRQLLKFDGRPLFPEDVFAWIDENSAGGGK